MCVCGARVPFGDTCVTGRPPRRPSAETGVLREGTAGAAARRRASVGSEVVSAPTPAIKAAVVPVFPVFQQCGLLGCASAEE